MSQANTIQASNITKVSREKASILISPDVKDISANSLHQKGRIDETLVSLQQKKK